MLQQLCPTYLELWDKMQNTKIHADLSQRGRYWCISLQEDLPQEIPYGHKWEHDIGNLDERVDWSCKQLESWPEVRRMAHDMWFFKRKRDAEKFQTLYNLKWASE